MKMLCGLTLAMAWHLRAHARTGEQDDPPQANTPEPSSVYTAIAATLPNQDDTPQAQTPSHQNVPADPRDPPPPPPSRPVEPPPESTLPEPPPSHADDESWLDRTRQTVYDTLWHSARGVDRW